MKKFLLIGNGNMGSSFANLLIPKFEVTVASPNSKPTYKSKYFQSINELNEVYDYITFAIKPHILPEVIKNLNPQIYNKNTKFISLVAGARIEYFKRKLGADVDVSTVMTNLPVRIGKGILAIYPPEKKIEMLETLGKCIYVPDEEEMDKFCALIACGSGFCYNLLEMYEKNAGILKMNSNFDIQQVIMNLFEGSLGLVKANGNSFEQEKNNVVNPKGPTHKGLQQLQKSDENFKNCFIDALKRTNELGEELSKNLSKQ